DRQAARSCNWDVRVVAARKQPTLRDKQTGAVVKRPASRNQQTGASLKGPMAVDLIISCSGKDAASIAVDRRLLRMCLAGARSLVTDHQACTPQEVANLR